MRFAPLPSTPMRHTLAAVLALALLLAQGLGGLHRIQHAQGPAPQGHDGHVQHAAADGHHAHHHALEELFSQHGDEQDCRLFDQLTHAQAPGFAIPAPSILPPADVHAAACAAPPPARRSAQHLARGPPAAG